MKKNNKNLIDLTGKKFGMLTVVGMNPEPYVSPHNVRIRRWDCICECGNKSTVTGDMLRSGNTRSCGCLKGKCARELNDTIYEELRYLRRRVKELEHEVDEMRQMLPGYVPVEVERADEPGIKSRYINYSNFQKKGLSKRQICELMGISEQTARRYEKWIKANSEDSEE